MAEMDLRPQIRRKGVKGVFDFSTVEPRNFLPCPFQVKLFEEAKSENLIVFLENDFGKTFIAVKLIDHFALQLRKIPKKISVFLHTDFEKLKVQATMVKNHLDLGVAIFDSTFLSKANDNQFWAEELKGIHVIALVPQLMSKLLANKILSLDQVNLIVFNEIHTHLKNEDYLKIMEFYQNIDEKPRILGLAANILQNKLGYNAVSCLIKHLEKVFFCKCRTIFNSYSKPREIIFQYDKRTYDVINRPEFQELYSLISEQLTFLRDSKIKCKSDWPVKLSKVREYFDTFVHILENMGLWCAYKLADIYVYELSAIISSYTTKDFTYSSALSAICSLFNYARTVLYQLISEYGTSDCLIKLASPKLNLLLEIISYTYSKKMTGLPLNNKASRKSRINDDGYNCLIFCRNRVEVRLLHLYLKEISNWSLNDCHFIKPDYVLGKIAGGISSKTFKPNRRQEEALNKYRKHEVNVLIAGCCFEERLDMPKSSVVIAYDLPQTVKQYVQIKEKTRNECSRCFFLVENDEKSEDLMYNLVRQERLLVEKCKDAVEKLVDTEKPLLEPFDENKLGTFQPEKKLITANASNAIAIVNRYCHKLPSDSFTKVFPQCSIEQKSEGYQCSIHLPINSPIRYAITGEILPTVKLAKKSCAIKVCRVLYEHGELDEHLMSVSKESAQLDKRLDIEPLSKENLENEEEARTGTTKKRRYYNKRVAQVLQGPTIKSDEECILYVITMRLTCPIPDEQNTRGRRIVDPADYKLCFGLLINKKMPKLCPFPIFTRSGEVLVEIKAVPHTFKFSQQQVQRLVMFHEFTFKEVLQLERYPMKFDVKEANCSHLLVPVRYDVKQDDSKLMDADIDWDFIEQVQASKDKKKTLPKQKNFEFYKQNFEDAVVRPWYRNEFQHYFYVAEICSNMTPLSAFPDDTHETFAEYYESKYKVHITNLHQPLLDVDHTSARLNLLTPRYVNRKGVTLPMSSERTKKEKRDNLNSKQLLVPELCIIHPFPASFWKKAVCMPCILYRINSLLLADELRVEVAKNANIGKIELSENEKWPALDFGWTLADVLEKNLPEIDEKPKVLKAKASPKDIPVTQKTKIADDGFVIDVFDPEKYKVDNNENDWEEYDDFLEDDEFLQDIDFQNIDGKNGMVFNINNKNIKSDVNMWDAGPLALTQGDNTGAPSVPNSSWADIEDSENGILDINGPNFSDITNGMSNLNMAGLSRDLAKIHSEQNTDLLNEYDSDDDLSVDYPGLVEEEAAEFDPSYMTKNTFLPPPTSNRKEEIANDVHSSGVVVMVKEKVEENFNQLVEIAPEIFEEAEKLPIEPIPANRFQKIKYEDKYEAAYVEEEQQVPITEFTSKLRELLITDHEQKLLEKQKHEEKLKSMHIAEPKTPENEPFQPSFGELLPRSAIKQNNRMAESKSTFNIKFDARKDEYDDSLGPNPQIILQALTMSNASDGINLERLETVGDSFLKYAVTAYLYCACDKIHEGKLSFLRSRQISNFNLFRLGRDKCLGELMVATKFEPSDNWLPPTFVIPKGLEKALVDLSMDNNISVYSIEPLKEALKKDISGDALREEIEKRRSQCILASNAREEEDDDIDVDELIANQKKTKNSVHCVESSRKLGYVPYNLLTQQSIPDKSIADCVESLIGAYLICAGPKGALLFMKWLGLKVMPKDLAKLNQDSNDPIWHWLPPVKSPLITEEKNAAEKLHEMYIAAGLDRFEKDIIQYEFKDKAYLVQAFTHNSFYDNRVTDCYQRLEFLGDAVLDFLITRYMYEDPAKHSPGVLTDLRSALVNNTFFASLAVKYDFHKYLKILSLDLFKVISNFVNKFNQTGDHFLSLPNSLLYVEEGECERNEDIEVPKALGDVFESVAGAIFLDSGMSLDAVWKVYFAMMQPEIEYFSKNVPKSPIRELLEMKPQNVKFGKAELIAKRKISVCVDVFGEGKFLGIGRNKRLAKSTAAKKALRYLKNKEKNEI